MERRKINGNGEIVTALHIEITETEEGIIKRTKQLMGVNKTSCIKKALKLWNDTVLENNYKKV